MEQGNESNLPLSQMEEPFIDGEDRNAVLMDLLDKLEAELISRGILVPPVNPENPQVNNKTSLVHQGNVSHNALTSSNIELNANGPIESEAPGARSVDPVLISSEARVSEEDGGREQGASSSDGGRPSFKRTAPDDPPRILLPGESSETVQDQEDVVGALNNNQANFVNHFGQSDAGAGSSATTTRHEPQYLAGGITGFQVGNDGATTIVNHHQTEPAACMWTNEASVQARQEETFERNTRFRRNPNPQDFSHVSQLPQNHLNYNFQPPNHTAMFLQHVQLMNLRSQPVHLPLVRYVQEPFQTGNDTSSSQDRPNPNLMILGDPDRYWDQPISYSNRAQEILRFSENQGPEGDDGPANAGSADAAEDMDISDRGGRIRISLGPRRRSRLEPTALSEVQNSLPFVRGGGGLRIVDGMLVGPREEDDAHEDLRLNIDDMSYEELVALGEQIGEVPTGLSEEYIFANLKVQPYKSLGTECPEDAAPNCCICQEKYEDGEDLGKLDCGHEFHANCIKQWLMQKNKCPVFKKRGLAG